MYPPIVRTLFEFKELTLNFWHFLPQAFTRRFSFLFGLPSVITDMVSAGSWSRAYLKGNCNKLLMLQYATKRRLDSEVYSNLKLPMTARKDQRAECS